MPSEAPPLQPSLPENRAAGPTDLEVVIEHRLRQTRRHVKSVDLTAGLLTLAVGTLAYLLAAAVLDHWIVAGGLEFRGRLILWLVLLASASAYFTWQLWTPLFRRINPLYAAAAIEKSRPAMKNSLINFLLLRGRRREVAPAIYQAMERRAAADLSHASIDSAIDRAHIVRLGCVLLALVAAFVFYAVFLPKNPLRTAARVLWPWAGIEAPARVTIRDVQPGDAAAFHGDSLAVSAEVLGLHDDEPVLFVYSTADGQSVDQTIPLTPADGRYRYRCRFPPGNLGLQQDCEYYLLAGDCKTRRYRIATRPAPAIAVEKAVYHFPSYTGLAPQTIEKQGDLRAIEGTEVTLYAKANVPIQPGSAVIDLGCTGRSNLSMTADGPSAIGRLTLRVGVKTAAGAEYDSYQIRFRDADGHENARPIRYRIDVIPDRPPIVRWIEPKEEESQVPEDGTLDLRLEAEDPDFALRLAVVRAERDGRKLPLAPLLEIKKPGEPRSGKFAGTYAFQPAKLGLRAGDRVLYWAEVEDNKEPAANRSATEKRRIVVGREQGRPTPDVRQGDRNRSDQPRESKPEQGKSESAERRSDSEKSKEPKESQPPESDPSRGEKPEEKHGEKPTEKSGDKSDSKPEEKPGEKPGEKSSDKPDEKPGEKSSEKSGAESRKESGEKPGAKSGEKSGEETGDKPDERVDPDTAPGDAMREILNDRRQQEREQQKKSDPSKTEKTEKQDPSQNKTEQGGKGQQSEQEKSGGQESGEKGAKGQPGGVESGAKGDPNEQGKRGDETKGQQGKPNDSRTPSAEKGEPGQEPQKSDQKGSEEKMAKSRKSDGRQPSAEKREKGETGETGEKAPAEQSAAEKIEKGEKGEKSRAEKGTGEQPEKGVGKKPEKGVKETIEKGSDQKPEKGLGEKTEKGAEEKTEKGLDAKSADEKPAGEKTDPGVGLPTQPDKKDEPGIAEKSGADSSSDRKSGEAKRKSEPLKTDPGKGKFSESRGEDRSQEKPSESRGEGRSQEKPSESRGEDRSQEKHPEGRDDGKPSEGRSEGRGEEKPSEPGKEQAADLSKSQAPSKEPGKPTDQLPDGAAPDLGDAQPPDAKPAGKMSAGGRPSSGPDDRNLKTIEPPQTGVDPVNLDYSRRQTELALEHLREQLAKEKPELLDRLGWTKEDARRFLDRWEQMRREADGEGPAAEAAKKRYDDALKSLGFRPRGAELKGGGVSGDKPQTLRDAGRHAPPPEWAEQYREYSRGLADPDRK